MAVRGGGYEHNQPGSVGTFGVRNTSSPKVGSARNAAGHIDSVIGRQKPRAIAYKASKRKA